VPATNARGAVAVPSVRVPNFDPATSGLIYPNHWPHQPIGQFRLGNVATLDIGDAANGLCGGMSYTVADLHARGLPPGDDPQPALGSDRYKYIVDRQIASFEGGRLPLRFFTLMSVARPARESQMAALLGRFGIDRHSRTYVMVHEEWPAIRRKIDGGQLAMIGLVRVVSADPTALSHNHQVLAYGYDLEGTTVVLRICDPNWARQTDVTITFDAADPMGTIQPSWSKPPEIPGSRLECFFTYDYSPIDPTPWRP
jgi:hypothetical protein